MSKQTKLIAAIGGGLILILIIFSAVTKGGCGGALDVWGGYLGCSSKKKGAKAKSSRNFCTQNPNHEACKGKSGGKAGDGDDDDDEKEDKGAKKARPAGDDAKKADKEDD